MSLFDELLKDIPGLGPAGEAIGHGAYRWEQFIKTGKFTGEENPHQFKGKQPQLAKRAAIVQDAANKWHIPGTLLWGIFGIETSHGSNIKTSTTGAKGAFQFEPETARKYGYPLTNTPTEQQFRQQADAAAHLLSDAMGGLKAKRTPANLERAVKIYNSGRPNAGYTLKEVLAHAGSMADVFSGEAENEGETARVEKAAEGKNPLEGIEAFFEAIGETSTWVRIGKGVAGLILIYMGLREFTKMGPSAGDVITAPVAGPTKAVRTVRKHQARKHAAAEQATEAASRRDLRSAQADAHRASARRGPAQHHHRHLHLHRPEPAAASPGTGAGKKPRATKGHGRPKGR